MDTFSEAMRYGIAFGLSWLYAPGMFPQIAASFSRERSRRLSTVFALCAPCALMLSMVGCHQSPEQIGSTVKDSMQDTFNKDPNFSSMHFRVDKVVAVKKSDTAYDGTASVNYKNTNHDVPVHITLDKDTVDWKTDPGALDFDPPPPPAAPADADGSQPQQ